MAQMQMQMECCEAPFCDFAAYFHGVGQLRVWRVYRSRAYWQWMAPKVLAFGACLATRQPPHGELFRDVSAAARQLAENGHDVGKLTERIDARQLPKKVFAACLSGLDGALGLAFVK